MPITSEHVEIERKPKLGGGGPGKIPHRRGYGGGDDGDPDRFRDFHSHQERLRRYRIGMVLCLISVSTLFVCLTLVYVFREQMSKWDPVSKTFVRDWKSVHLPYLQLWINSTVLVLSSVTLEFARKSMKRRVEFSELGILPVHSRRDVPWLAVTVLLGFTFLAGQVMVWNHFRLQGVFHHSNPGSSFFFILTGMHAIHLLGGLLALLYAATGSLTHTKFESQLLAVEVTGWYWHFMAGLWLYIFGLLYFVR